MLESIWVTVMSFATLDLRLVLMSWGPWCCLGLCGSTDSTDTPCVQNCADPKKLAPDPLAMHITPKPWQHLHCIYIEMEDNIRQPSVYMGQKQRAPDMFGNGVSQCFCTGHMNSAVSESANVSRTWNPWLNHLWLLQPWHSLTVSHGRCGSLWDGVAEAPEPCCEAQCSTRKILHKFLQVSSWSYVCGIVGHLVQVPRTMWRSLVSHLSLWPIGWLKLFFSVAYLTAELAKVLHSLLTHQSSPWHRRTWWSAANQTLKKSTRLRKTQKQIYQILAGSLSKYLSTHCWYSTRSRTPFQPPNIPKSC
jgi:hypothetical protein